jgi:hypothetical protein
MTPICALSGAGSSVFGKMIVPYGVTVSLGFFFTYCRADSGPDLIALEAHLE